MHGTEAAEHLSEALAHHVDGRAEFGETRELHRRCRKLVARCRNAVGIGNDRAVRARLDDLSDALDDATSHRATAGASFSQAQAAVRAAASVLTEVTQ